VLRFPPGGGAGLASNQGLSERYTRALVATAEGVWAGTGAGLFRWDGAAWQGEAGLPPAVIDVLAADGDGTVWAGTRAAGLWQRRGSQWRRFSQLDANQVTALLRDRAGRLWVATGGPSGRLEVVEPDGIRSFPLPDRLCGNHVQALAEDDAGGLWLGTELCGLHRLSDRPLRAITTADGLPSNAVLGLGLQPGAVVVGTRGGGLSRVSLAGKAQPLACAPGLPCDECWDFTPTPDGFLSVCRGNVVLRGPQMARVQPPGLPAASFALVARDGASWFALGDQVVRAQAGQVTRVSTPLQGYRILFEGQNDLWIGGDDGLVAWRAGQTRVVRLPATERPAEVASFLEDGATLWMATKGEGLRRLRGERIDTVGVAQGLPTGWLIQLLQDDGPEPRIWASSSKGIFWVSKRELEEVADGRRARLHARLYDGNDGVSLRSESFGHPAGFKDGRGQLWFASNSGLLVVDPARTRGQPAPAVVIDEVRLDGRRVAPASVSARGGRDLDVAFTALTFAPADTVSLRYRLGGAWIELGPVRALHLPLPPGEHQLELAARTRESGFGRPARLTVSLAPPLWRSAPVLLLTAGVLALLLLGLHRARLHRTRAGLQAVLAERTRIAREIHDTLAQAFVATSVQLECLEEALEAPHVVDHDNDVRVRRHLAIARKVVAESLDEARRALWVLRPQTVEPGLVPALHTLAAQGPRGVAVVLHVSGVARQLPALVASNLLRIANEGVANARRHAGAHHIELRLAFSPRSVTLSVADDGAGMGAGTAGIGQGLLGMKERAAQMGGTLSIDSIAGRGTTVHVEVAA
jgi:signal transduction histidine kinase